MNAPIHDRDREGARWMSGMGAAAARRAFWHESDPAEAHRFAVEAVDCFRVADKILRGVLTGGYDEGDADRGLAATLADLLAWVDCQICRHEAITHKGAWEICDNDDCGQRWADSEGGFSGYQEPSAVTRARETVFAAESTPAKAPPAKPAETPVTVIDAVMAIFEVVRNEEDWAFLVDRLAVEYDRDGEPFLGPDDQEGFDADRRFADVLRRSIVPAEPPASPPEDWPSPLMVASGDSTPEGAAQKLGWPLSACEAIHAQFLASSDPYEVRYLKAVRAGKASMGLGRNMDPPRDDAHAVYKALEDLARPFMDELEGGGGKCPGLFV